MREALPRMRVRAHLASWPAQAPGPGRGRGRHHHLMQTEGDAGAIQEACFVICQDLSRLGTEVGPFFFLSFFMYSVPTVSS